MRVEQEWAIDDGVTVSGRKGLFTPADAYRLDKLWSNKGAISAASGGDVDWSFVGDVEGMTLTDSSGTKVANLTVRELEGMKTKLAEFEIQLSDVINSVNSLSASLLTTSTKTGTDASEEELRSALTQLQSSVSTLQNNLTQLQTEMTNTEGLSDSYAALREETALLRAEMENVTENQRSYIRYADYSTVDGSMVLVDGYGIETFTLGGATFETVSDDESLNPDD